MTPAEIVDLASHRLQSGDARGAIAICDLAIKSTPDIAALWQLSGLGAFALGRFAEAAERFERAWRLEPSEGAHAVNFGNALIKLDRDADAERVLSEALRLAPSSAETRIALGTLARRAGRLEDAVAFADGALALNPNSYQALVNRGRALHELGRFAEAIASYDRAIAIDAGAAPGHAQKALTLLLTGDLAAGWEEYEWRGEGGDSARLARFSAPEWDGGPLEGQTLLVHAEQGFGDTIQFARFLPLAAARGGRVAAEVQPQLKRLMSGFVPAVEIVARGEPLPHFDRQIRLLSLPRVLGTRIETIPPPASFKTPRMARIAKLLPSDPKLTVGLSWAGNPAHENDRNRSIAPALLSPLGALDGIRFVSLQKGAPEAGSLGFPHIDLAPEIQDFADLAAAMRRLDLVISVDSAPAHLMSSLGRPVWLLLPDPPDWRWLLDREDSPWCPTARLFRQKARGDWQEVVGRVAAALAKFRSAGSRSD